MLIVLRLDFGSSFTTSAMLVTTLLAVPARPLWRLLYSPPSSLSRLSIFLMLLRLHVGLSSLIFAGPCESEQ